MPAVGCVWMCWNWLEMESSRRGALRERARVHAKGRIAWRERAARSRESELSIFARKKRGRGAAEPGVRAVATDDDGKDKRRPARNLEPTV